MLEMKIYRREQEGGCCDAVLEESIGDDEVVDAQRMRRRFKCTLCTRKVPYLLTIGLQSVLVYIGGFFFFYYFIFYLYNLFNMNIITIFVLGQDFL
jgi:hypothetical protein